MKNLKTTYKYVNLALRMYPETRKDDFKLILEVYYLMWLHGKLALPVNPTELTLQDLGEMGKTYNCPSFESITRGRRKAQELDPRLKDEESKDLCDYLEYKTIETLKEIEKEH